MTDPATASTTIPRTSRLGAAMSLAMVVGTMIGSGIYLLPTTLAPFGPNILVAFAVTIGGTMCLAWSLAQLAARIPGGPFAYVGAAFGDTPAFPHPVELPDFAMDRDRRGRGGGGRGDQPCRAQRPEAGSGLTIVALGTIAILTLINLTGARSAGWVQVASTLIKIVPLFAVVLLVAVRFGSARPVEHLAAVPLSLAGIAGAAAMMLFALTGFESAATVTANVTDDAEANVPRATIRGTAFTGLIYLAATVAALMLLPSASAVQSSSPFADAIAPTLGPAAGSIVAIIAAISAFGTCNALLLLASEVGRSIAGTNDLPAVFRRSNTARVSPPDRCSPPPPWPRCSSSPARRADSSRSTSSSLWFRPSPR